MPRAGCGSRFIVEIRNPAVPGSWEWIGPDGPETLRECRQFVREVMTNERWRIRCERWHADTLETGGPDRHDGG